MGNCLFAPYKAFSAVGWECRVIYDVMWTVLVMWTILVMCLSKLLCQAVRKSYGSYIFRAAGIRARIQAYNPPTPGVQAVYRGFLGCI